MMLRLTLLLLLSLSLLRIQAQDWEEVRFEDFSDGISGLEGLANDGFSAYGRYGATGGFSDDCIRSSLSLGNYVAFQADLSGSYEYRFSWNLKAAQTYTRVNFSLTQDLNQDILLLLDDERVNAADNSDPGTDYTSDIFTGYTGIYYLKLEIRRGAGGSTRRLYADNFRFERRLIEVIPPVSVSTSDLSMDEGQQTQICFDVAAAPTSTLTFDFALTGNASPHFNNYTTQTISFPAGSNEPQCITLTTDPLDDLQSSNTFYVFDMQNIMNGELSANSSVMVEVIDQTPAPPPLVSFITSSLDLDEGASSEICLGLSSAPTETASVEVVLLGNKSPHFDDYTTTTINFPTESTNNQCFTLNTDPIDQALSGYISYSFVLQTPVGSEMGNVNQLTVNVSDQSTQALSTISFVTATASLTAGEDLQVCLSISEAPSTSASVEVAISGNSAPHFSSFATTTVQFPIGETGNQCFNLSSLLAPEVIEPTNYTFVLQNPVAAELSTSNNLVLTVNPPATGVDCPYAGPDQTICAGETIAIGCPDDPNDPSPYCFKWEPEIGFVEEFGSTQPNPTIQPEETTTYTLYVTDGNGSLIAEEELLIVVNSGGNLTITPESPIVCNGGVVVLDAGSGFESYLWSTGATTQIIEVTSEGPYGVTVTDDASNCIVTESIQVTKSDPSLTILPSNPILCEELIQIEAVGDFLDYVWMDEAGEVIGIDATVEITEPGQFQLFARDDLGCEIEKVFQVEPGITELTVSPSLAHLCLDGSLTLSVNQSFISYSWYNGNEELLGTGQDLTVYSTGSIRVEVTNTYGCTKGLEFIVEDAIASNVSISPANPSICYSDNPGLIDQNSRGTAKNDNDCQQQQVTLETGAGYSSYIWSNNATTPTIVVDQLGTYAVTVVDENGCTGVAETIVKACTTEELVISPTPGHLIGTDPVTFTANLGFSTYTWSTGETSSSIDVSTPGTYTLSVTDEKGCMNSKTFTVQEISADAVVDLELYKPAVIAGNTTTVVQNEDGIGGMTYVNLDNDDRDRKLDNVDNVVSNDGIEGDNELMRLRLKLDPDGSQNRTVRLLAIEGGQFVRIWQGNDKHRNQEYILGDEIQLVEQDGDFWVSELWIEGILAHQSQRATVLQLLYNNSVDAQIFDEVSITVVGVKAMTWQGIGNGFVNANNVSSNDLDMNDPNFGDQRNADGTSMLNMRVFPAGRILSPVLVSELRNSVNLAVELTVEPVEDCVLYLKVLDVDDPSSSHRMLDPNDRSRRPGFYRGTQVYTQQLNYEEHNDNRGLVDGCCKFGVLDGDDDRDGIIEMRFTTGTSLQSVGFRVSIFPGDNYRVAGFFDSAFADSWVNLDHRGHGLGIVDAFSNREIQLPSNYLSPVLTVWRLLHIEYDSMENLLDPQNDVMGFITDFHGARASRTRRVTQLITTNGNIIDLNDSPTNVDNLASLNLDYAGGKWKGRFENGQLTIGNSEPANQVSVVGNGNQEVRLSRPLLNSTRNLTFMLQEGISMVTGQVSEIRKAGVNFEFTLMNLTGNLTPFTTGAVFSISNGQGMEIVDIDITNSRLIGRNLRIPFNLSDDDANQADGILPYNFVNDNDGLLTGLDAYQRAYLECIPFQQNLHPNLAFQADAGLSQHFGIFIDANDSRILESQGDDDSVPNFGDRVWLAYLSTAFQTGFWRKDRDPDLEKEKDPTMDKLTGINLGITLTPRDVTSLIDDEILPGRQYSMIPFETFREEGANNLRARSIAHELGHQFGIPHYKGKSNLMNESLDQGNNGTFLPFQLNLIRSRKLSPGAGVE